MKWVGTPMSLRFWKMNSEIRLLSTPLPSMTSCFLALKAVASSLKCWIERSRLRTLIEDLRLAFVDATAAVHRDVPWFEEIHELAVAP